jgi:hypothetical protein
MSYTKRFNSIITSTIWTEDDKTRILWITMLALADKNGEVQASIPGLARVAGMSVECCEAAIGKFLSPDPYSRTPDDEGRRIEVIDGGWALLNHGKYREMASRDEQKEAEAERKRRYRERLARNGREENVPEMSQNVPDMSHDVPKTLHIAEAEAEADTDLETDDKNQNEEREPILRGRGSLSSSDLAAIGKINSVGKGWAKLPVLSAKELSAYQINRDMLKAVPEASWAQIRAYYAAKLPEGKPAHRPRSRERFIADLPDIAEYADQWERSRPKPAHAAKKPEQPDEPGATPEEIAEMFKDVFGKTKKPA